MNRWINRKPGRAGRLVLGLLPFVLALVLYSVASAQRLSENPRDKLLPSLSAMAQTFTSMAFEPDRRTGEYLLLNDTVASLKRIATAVILSGLIALIFGVSCGAIPYVRAQASPIIAAISLIPPMAILPILFIVFGLGELSKILLIVIGITPFLARDLQQKVLDLPVEQLIKAQTLGANSWQIIVRIIIPQVMPRLLESLRLSLGAAWLFLIAAEAIVATEGLGYRIFLVRRYMAMDVILPYVVWITLLAYWIDVVIRRYSRWQFAWLYRSDAT